MRISIEFTGITKSITKASEIDFDVPNDSTYRDIVKMLAVKFPEMIGLIIDQDGETFLSSNLFVINGDLAYPAMIMESVLHEEDQISLVSVITGG